MRWQHDLHLWLDPGNKVCNALVESLAERQCLCTQAVEGTGFQAVIAESLSITSADMPEAAV